MPRRPFVGGNWKLNGSFESIAALTEAFNTSGPVDSVEVVIFPTLLALDRTRMQLKHFGTGAQDVSVHQGFGAMTGEISPQLLVEGGIRYVLTGHSERRHKVAHEAADLVAQKTLSAIKAGLTVVLCIGEKLEDRDEGKMLDVLQRQMQPVIASLAKEHYAKLVIAYEPVWAIGTGRTASPEQAQEAHCALRALLAKAVGEDVASSIRIIYGGSVKPHNAEKLFEAPDIDGFLVGGASLKPSFVEIIGAAAAGAARL